MIDCCLFICMVIMGIVGVIVVGCDCILQSDWGLKVLNKVQGFNCCVQVLLVLFSVMVKEYIEVDFLLVFCFNGIVMFIIEVYQLLLVNGFCDYCLQVGGLVDCLLLFVIDDFKQIEQVVQIICYDCVEGWSVIGKWYGVWLLYVLDKVGVKLNVCYVVFYCYDEMDFGELYYESVDIFEVCYLQILLVWGFNNQLLLIKNGVLLCLCVSCQFGYKQVKYIVWIELVDLFVYIVGGKGGYWEDYGYEWYVGI